MNAFQVDLSKALQSCEIIKTRVPFLYQENKFISWEVPAKDAKADEGELEEDLDEAKEGKIRGGKRIRTGISITLSKIQFEVTNMAGYQKPKPRQFLQPLPARQKYFPSKDESEEERLPKKKRAPKNKKTMSAERPQRVNKM